MNGLGAGAWGIKGAGGGAMTGALLGTGGMTGLGGLAGATGLGSQMGTAGGLSEQHNVGGAYGLGKDGLFYWRSLTLEKIIDRLLSKCITQSKYDVISTFKL